MKIYEMNSWSHKIEKTSAQSTYIIIPNLAQIRNDNLVAMKII